MCGCWAARKPRGGQNRGHLCDRYLSACALAFATTGEAGLKKRGDGLVAGLTQYQQALGKAAI